MTAGRKAILDFQEEEKEKNLFKEKVSFSYGLQPPSSGCLQDFLLSRPYLGLRKKKSRRPEEAKKNNLFFHKFHLFFSHSFRSCGKEKIEIYSTGSFRHV